MKTVVAWTEAFGGLDPRRRIGGQPAGLRIEPELHDHIRARVLLRRLQDVVVETRDMRHKRELVGGIGRYRVGTGRRGQPIEGRSADCALRPKVVHRHAATLIIAGQQIPPGAVGCQKGRRMHG